jgi:hypothetical protein
MLLQLSSDQSAAPDVGVVRGAILPFHPASTGRGSKFSTTTPVYWPQHVTMALFPSANPTVCNKYKLVWLTVVM